MQRSVYRGVMLRDLAVVLGCTADDLPAVFLHERRPRPLKVGVGRDLRKRFPDADARRLERWLRMWTKSRHYLGALATSLQRYDLDGRGVAFITDADREYARKAVGTVRRPHAHIVQSVAATTLTPAPAPSASSTSSAATEAVVTPSASTRATALPQGVVTPAVVTPAGPAITTAVITPSSSSSRRATLHLPSLQKAP
jgi:sRNA-binding protein